jgi:hypothetical protein
MRVTIQNTDEIRILALEYDATAYDFGTIAVSDSAPNTNLPDLSTAAQPTWSTLTAVESLYVTTGYGVKARIEFSWDAVADIFVKEYDVEWRIPAESGTWRSLTTTKNLTARLDDVDIKIHQFRVRSVNTIGVRSLWTSLLQISVVGYVAPQPTALIAVESLYNTIGSGGVKARVSLDWNIVDDGYTNDYQVQWKEDTQSVWKLLTKTPDKAAILNDVNPVLHDFRVRTVNANGVTSSWTTLNNFTVAGLTTPPVDVSGMSFIALNNAAHLSWDLATDLDVRVGGKVRFRHSNLTTGASWESSTDIGAAVSGLNTNAVLPLLTGTYLAKFIDSTGNESVNTSSFVSTTIPNIINMNAVATSTQNPSFTGTKTNMVAVDNVLKFEADTLLDSVTELMDDWGLLDAIGGVDTSGSYEFDTYLDLGAVYTSRATASIAFTAFVIGDFIDNRTALMDTWTDFDNAPSDVTLNLYVATTNDDPSGTPTWSSWAKFTVADYSARAYKFKVEASSTNADHQINITELSVAVDMPDTVQGANALTSLSTGLLSVTYATPFKAIPALGVTFTDLDSNDILDIQNETTTGFDVGVKHGSNYEAHNFNYLARGY